MTPTGGKGSSKRAAGSANAKMFEPTRNSTHFGDSSLCKGNPIVDP